MPKKIVSKKPAKPARSARKAVQKPARNTRKKHAALPRQAVRGKEKPARKGPTRTDGRLTQNRRKHNTPRAQRKPRVAKRFVQQPLPNVPPTPAVSTGTAETHRTLHLKIPVAWLEQFKQIGRLIGNGMHVDICTAARYAIVRGFSDIAKNPPASQPTLPAVPT